MTGPTRSDAQRNRRRILAAAAEVFAARPDASLADVAAAAQTTRVTVHRHFPTRDALVRAVLLQALDEVAAALACADLDRGDVHEGVGRALDAVFAVAQHYAVLASGPATDFADAGLTARFDAVLEPVTALFERGQRAGDVTTDLPAWWLADQLFSLVLSALLRAQDGTIGEADAAALARTTLQLLTRP